MSAARVTLRQSSRIKMRRKERKLVLLRSPSNESVLPPVYRAFQV